MAKRGESLDDQLRDFESNMGRKNIGNFPDELDPHAPNPILAETPEPAPDDDTPPEPDPTPAPVVEPDEPPVDEPPVQSRRPDRLAELEQRLERQSRELEFFRAGQVSQPVAAPVQAPVDPVGLIDQYLGGMRVTPEDVQVLMNDPVRGAEYLMNGIRAAVAAGAAIATNQIRAEYRQEQANIQGATQLRDAFYGQHPDLQPYAKLVQQAATDVRAQYPSISPQALIEQTAQQVRGQLQQWGVRPKPAQVARGPQRRVRPAQGEMGGGHTSSAGGRALTPLEKQLRSFEAQGQKYLNS